MEISKRKKFISVKGNKFNKIENVREDNHFIFSETNKRNKNENKLSTEEKKFREIYENAYIGIYRTTPGGKVLMVNPMGLKMMGYKSFDEIKNRNIAKEGYAPGYTREQFIKQIEKYGEVIGLETAWKKKDGTILYIRESARAVRDSEGKTLFYEGTIEDITERVLAVNALIESESKYRDLVEKTYDAIFLVDKNGKILLVNPKACELLGYTEYELLKLNITDTYLREERALSKKRMQIVSSSSKQITFERKVLKKDGTTFLAEVTFGLLPSGYFQGIMRDITERKKAEEALRQSEERYRTLVNTSPYAITQTDLNGKILFLNKMGFDLFKFTKPEEVIGTSLFEHTVKEEHSRLAKGMKLVLKEGTRRNKEYRMYKRDGEIIPVELSASVIKDSNEKPIAMTGVAIDITQRKRAEHALKESESKYRDLIDKAWDAIFIADSNGRFKIVNQKACELSGYTQEELLKMKIEDTYIPEDIKYYRKRMKIIKAGHSLRFERNILRKDGTTRPVESTFGILPNGMIQGILRDITDRKRFEERQKITVDLLKIMNTTLNSRQMIKKVVQFIKKQFRFDAVGIRYRDGYDFPYLESRGFSIMFLKKENKLCAVDEQGKIINDKSGHPILECMCGRVIKSIIDPSKSYFTAGGSFWTNSTSKFVSTNKNSDKTFRMRNRCNTEGYESLALIPLKISENTVGLLQLCSVKKNKFTADLITFFEQLCENISMSISEKKTKELLKKNEESLKMSMYQVKEVNKRLRDLSTRLNKVREEERINVARELHDGLGQSLTGMKLDMSWLGKQISNPESYQNRLRLLNKINDMTQRADDTIKTIRKIATDLRPPMLDQLGLFASIEWLIDDFRNRSEIKLSMHSNIKKINLDSVASTNVFRILQETLTNIIRHSSASEVNISLNKTGKDYILEILDNGIGMNKNDLKNPKSIGIKGMRERALLCGGRIDVEGKPGEGTKVTLKIPRTL
jgi:PAS domain S-box-containing protein